MNFVLTLALTAIVALSSLLGPASDAGAGHDNPTPNNMSPCLPEDVNACQASGGTFNWRHCTCE